MAAFAGPTMLKYLLAAILLCVVPTWASAKTFKLGGDMPIASIAIPDGWDADAADGGIEALSPDKGIYLSAEIVDSADLKDAGQETARNLAEQKITLKQETKKQVPVAVDGLPGVEIVWDATDPDGPTQVHLTVLKVVPDKAMLLVRWGTDAQEKSHAAELESVMKSIAPIK